MVMIDKQQKLSLMEPKISFHVLNICILLKQTHKKLNKKPFIRRLKQKPQRDSAYWLSPSELFCSHSYTAQAVSKDGIAHSELGPSTSINNWEGASQKWPLANLIEAIFQLRFLLSKWL